jgi:DNA-binding CsgD family transcriptional regulator
VSRAPQLTAREREVVTLYASTGSAKIVAAQLGIRPGTVKAHLSNARSRAGVDTTVQLVVLVVTGELRA